MLVLVLELCTVYKGYNEQTERTKEISPLQKTV